MTNTENDSSKWLEFGPMDQISIGGLTSVLDSAEANYEVQASEDDLRSSIKKISLQDFGQYPTFSGYSDVYFIKTPLENALLIKQDLEKIGFKIKGVDAPPELASIEFLCPKCDEVANVPGFCVRDGHKRLEFSDWVDFKDKDANGLGLNLKSGIIIALIGALFYLYLFAR